MIKEVEINEGFQPTKVFDGLRVGDMIKIPYDKGRHASIRSIASRKNRDERLMKNLKGKMDRMYAVSKEEFPGYTTILKIK